MVCDICEQEMLEADSCKSCPIVIDGEDFEPVPYETDDPNHKCHDCGVKAGGIHHPGCDMECCPRCEGQLISCGCLEEEEEDGKASRSRD